MESSPEDGIQDAIRTIQADASSNDEVQAALRAIEPGVTGLARRVCLRRRIAARIRCEFVEEAIGLLWQRLAAFDPQKGEFAGWAWTVLDRALLSKLREEILKVQLVAEPEEYEPKVIGRQTPAQVEHDEQLDRNARFSDADLRRIDSWDTRERLRLLAVGLLWHKMPAEVWEAWCREEDVELPFPPGICDSGTESAWMQIIAAAMSESWGAFKKRWYRKRELLAHLDFVKGLRNGK